MHPIEHLRHVARARGVDAASLVRETAIALGSLGGDRANLVIACRRIVERHPEAGPLWWLCANVLTAADPAECAWNLADEVEHDRAPRAIAAALPADATVLTIGWPPVGGEALMRRGDATVLCADSRFEASAFLQRLERRDVACEPVPAEAVARAAAVSDVVLIDATAACATRVLAPVGSHVLAAVARSVGTPVWLAVGVGRRLPVDYVDAIAERTIGRVAAAGWDVDLDDVPVDLLTHVASADGVAGQVAAALAGGGPFVPELLRTSAI